ncbi:MAG: class I SAM-dependent methyltransferase [Phycisphaerae bacterium]
MQTQSVTIRDVERWNDTFAREHDIDDYYTRSGFVIRWIEQRRLACIRKMIAATPDDRILEVGCGGGHVLRLFPQSDLTGVDVSDEMLRKARRNLEGYRVRLLKGEPHELDLPDRGFDRIICSEVLEHVVDPAAMLDQIRRLVHPDGRVVVTIPNDRLVNRLKAVIGHTGLVNLPAFGRTSWGGDKYHLHIWRAREMRDLLSRYFRVSQTRLAPYRWLPIRCCFLCFPAVARHGSAAS